MRYYIVFGRSDSDSLRLRFRMQSASLLRMRDSPLYHILNGRVSAARFFADMGRGIYGDRTTVP